MSKEQVKFEGQMTTFGIDVSKNSTAVTVQVPTGETYQYVICPQGVYTKSRIGLFSAMATFIEFERSSHPDKWCNLNEESTKRCDALQSIIASHVPDCDFVANIEGPSYGSRGATFLDQVFIFSQVMGILEINMALINVIPPKTLKKFATNNGNADKSEMVGELIVRHEWFQGEILKHPNHYFTRQRKVPQKPLDDIVDSYWLSIFPYVIE